MWVLTLFLKGNQSTKKLALSQEKQRRLRRASFHGIISISLAVCWAPLNCYVSASRQASREPNEMLAEVMCGMTESAV